MTVAANGTLTERWRRDRGLIDVGDIPAGWSLHAIADIAECLDKLRKPVNAKDRAARLGDVPYYGANGQVGWIDEALFDEELVLVVEDETFTGRTKPFSYMIKGPAWVNNHAHVLRPRQGVSARMLNILLSYYDFIPLTSGTTGRRKLNQGALMAARLLVPPQEEGEEISRLVELSLADSDTLLERIHKAGHLIYRGSQRIGEKSLGSDFLV